MIFNTGSLKYKIITAPAKPRPSGRKLAPPPIAKPSAKPAAPSANNQQSVNPKWLLTLGIGD